MVYVGKKGVDAEPDASMKLPEKYSGNAFDENGVKRDYDPDGTLLKNAEEFYRRGYVFDGEQNDSTEVSATAEDSYHEVPVSQAPAENARKEVGDSKEVEKESVPASGKAQSSPARGSSIVGQLGGILGKISTEDILLGALILMLYINGTDEELLIMLAILLFC